MNKKIALLLLLSLLIVAGCKTAAAPAEPVVAEEPAAPVVEDEPVEIAFWYPYGEGSWTGDFLAAKITEFNEANPMITVVGQSYDSYTAIIEALQRASAAGNLPGVATIGYGFDEYIVNSGIATLSMTCSGMKRMPFWVISSPL